MVQNIMNFRLIHAFRSANLFYIFRLEIIVNFELPLILATLPYKAPLDDVRDLYFP